MQSLIWFFRPPSSPGQAVQRAPGLHPQRRVHPERHQKDVHVQRGLRVPAQHRRLAVQWWVKERRPGRTWFGARVHKATVSLLQAAPRPCPGSSRCSSHFSFSPRRSSGAVRRDSPPALSHCVTLCHTPCNRRPTRPSDQKCLAASSKSSVFLSAIFRLTIMCPHFMFHNKKENSCVT